MSSAAGSPAKRDVNLLIALSRHVGLERQDVAAAVDDREFVYQALEFGDEMRRYEDGPPARVAILIRADDGLDELPPDDWIESRCRLVEHEQVGLRTDGSDERQLRLLAFREVAGLLSHIQTELRQKRALGVPVPAAAERGEVVEGLPDRHPWIERHVVRDIGDPGLHRDLVARRVEAEDARLAARRAEEIQQALDRRGLAGAVATEEAVAPTRLHAQVESVDGVGPAVAADEVAYVDDRVGLAHGHYDVEARARLSSSASNRSSAS